ncbi:MAG TPA: shikimate kinase [Terriglobales bacterium]|nr:shikimate kinase [Terriglobales bacterium]
MNVFLLVGFMGAGKTSVGRALAKRLGWRFYDLDEEIERIAACTIAEIFRNSGEAEFRLVETEALRKLLAAAHEPAVIALGGGAAAQPENASLIDLEHTVFLDAPVEELWRRCQEHETERPLRRDREQFRELYEARRRSYSAAAIIVQTAGKSVEEVAAEIAHRAGIKDPAKEK